MKQAGISSVAELCRQMKITRRDDIGTLLFTRRRAHKKTAGWTKPAKALASFFGCLPEDLFNEDEQIWGPGGKAPRWYYLSMNHLQSTSHPKENLHKVFERILICQKLSQSLEKIGRKNAKILRLRYGIGTDVPMTLREVGRKLKLSHEQIRLIEKRALEQLKKVVCTTGLGPE
jgi:hypothetical protein